MGRPDGPARRRIPWFASLQGGGSGTLPKDLLAGTMLAGLLVPQGLGYAGIAGVEIQRGLYAAFVGLVAYAAFGTSRHLVVSPTSSSAAMLAAAVAPLAAQGPASYGSLAAGLAIGTGLILILGSILRLGFVSAFIARPVLKGFTFGLALRIIVKQAPALFGVPATKGSVFAQAWGVLSGLGDAHALTAAVGLIALASLILLPKATKAVPAGLCVLVLGLVAVAVLGLDEKGVSVLGRVPSGLPVPGLPGIGFGEADALWAAGIGIAVIVYVESLSGARTLAAKNAYDIDPNRELLALGAANVASGLFHGICVGGGLSATAANDAAGARTAASVITASAVIVLTLLFLMPVFERLPSAVLAAIVIDAVRRLVDVKELARYVRLRSGVLPHLTAAVGVVALGVLPGMLLAVILSVVLLLKHLSQAQVRELGRVGESHVFAPVGGEEPVVSIPGLVVLRLDGPLFYANVDRVRDAVRDAARREPKPRQVLLNLGAAPVLGVASSDALDQMRDDLAREGVELALCRVTPEARSFLVESGVLSRFGEDRVFSSQNDAVDAFASRGTGRPAAGA